MERCAATPPNLAEMEFDYACSMKRRPSRTPPPCRPRPRLLRGRASPGAQRHTDREPSGRILEPVRIPQSGHAGRGPRFQHGGRSRAQSRGRCAPLLAQALRPFILRRTKAAGGARTAGEDRADASTASSKARQRKLYDELREHYRESLLGARRHAGMAKSKMQVLEALLRLRQAACHPGLIDAKRSGRAQRQARRAAAAAREVLRGGP